MQLHKKTAMEIPKPRAGVLTITAYVQGKSVLPETPDPIKLSSNESSFGPSPKAVEAFKSEANSLHRYPDGSQSKLREAIAEVHGLDVNKIVCGNGSEELIGLLVRAYIGPGDELLLSENHFVMCPIYGRTQDADIVFAPEKDYVIDVDAMLERLSVKTRMVIIANPNNPTGTYIPGSELRRLHAGIPSDILLVIDNAYAEYVVRDDYETGIELVKQYENVVVTHTFSKIYGLSGLRIGWIYCPDHVIDVIQRIRTPFNTNCAALAAAAAAVMDTEYIAMVRGHNNQWLQRITDELTSIGLKVIPSVANFYLISFEGHADKSAVGAAKYLEFKSIIPRTVDNSESDDVLRITVGLEQENQAVLQALTEYMA